MALLTGSEKQYYQGQDGVQQSGDENYGEYQFTSLQHVINNFMVAYVGEDKLISKVKKPEVSYHAQRALQELSFDVFKSTKSQEIEIPSSLTMPLPRDYINYVNIAWIDSSGIEHTIYPARKTSNPTSIQQYDNGDYVLNEAGSPPVDYTFTTVTTSPKVTYSTTLPTDINIGDLVTGTGIPENTVVVSILVTDKKLILNNTPTSAGTPALRFTALSNNLKSQITTIELTNSSGGTTAVDYTEDDYFVNASGADDGDLGVKVGMRVVSADFGPGTYVTEYPGSGNIFYVSTPAINDGTTQEMNLYSLNDISNTWSNYKSATPNENQDDYQDDEYWPNMGNRYGLDPQHAQVNGSFFIDEVKGKIHFSSNISGKTIVLKYLSDGLGTDEEMKVHKLAEEAIYKWIAYAVISTRANTPRDVIARFKKERFAETRKAKLRLSNIKLEEITQILRGKSKQIKH